MSFWDPEHFIFAILCHSNKISQLEEKHTQEIPLLMALGQAFKNLCGRQISREELPFLHWGALRSLHKATWSPAEWTLSCPLSKRGTFGRICQSSPRSSRHQICVFSRALHNLILKVLNNFACLGEIASSTIRSFLVLPAWHCESWTSRPFSPPDVLIPHWQWEQVALMLWWFVQSLGLAAGLAPPVGHLQGELISDTRGS